MGWEEKGGGGEVSRPRVRAYAHIAALCALTRMVASFTPDLLISPSPPPPLRSAWWSCAPCSGMWSTQATWPWPCCSSGVSVVHQGVFWGVIQATWPWPCCSQGAGDFE